MKRIITASVLVFFTALFCVTSILWQKHQTEILVQHIERMEQEFDADNPQKSLPSANRLIEEFEERTRLYPMFLRHNLITDAESELLTIPALLEKGECKDVPAALVRCRTKLITLYESELPLWENIF